MNILVFYPIILVSNGMNLYSRFAPNAPFLAMIFERVDSIKIKVVHLHSEMISEYVINDYSFRFGFCVFFARGGIRYT